MTSRSSAADEEQWSTVIPNTGTSSRGEIRRCSDPLCSPQIGHHGSLTMYEAFRHGQAINPLGPCLGFRAVSTNGMATPFIYSTYTEVLARVNNFAAGLDTLNLVAPTEDGMTLIGLYMKNCMEWFMAEQAIFCMAGATVPFYDTLGADSVNFILDQTETRTVICTRDELKCLCEVKATGKVPNFKTAIVINGVTPEAANMAKAAGLDVLSFAKVEMIGAERIATRGHQHTPPSAKDVFTFCYTSGTTGNPKGALLTHENMVSSVASSYQFLPGDMNDRHLSYLPLAHIFERLIQAQVYSAGGAIAFYRGDPLFLIEDLQACRPTIFPAAPRVLNKIHDKIQAGISAAGGFKKRLFDSALGTKTENLEQHGILTHGLYDRLIFSKIKKGLGMDRLRCMVSGSAPLSPKVMTFYRCMLGVPVIEGYGQTEGCAVACVSGANDMATSGHVGGPIAAVEVVLVDVPEMGYLHTDTAHKGQPCQGRGEIWVRGPTVFKGYFKDLEKTQETINEDGWLLTGDIGLWTTQGQLQIIDRKKNIFKLSQGEYVAPEKIENCVIQSLYVGQAFVYGDSFQNRVVAIIVPDEDFVRTALTNDGQEALAKASFADVCQNPQFQKTMMAEVQKACKDNKLYGFEIPKAIHVSAEPFSVENGLLTPTFKLKRQQARDMFSKEIEKMYATMSPPPSKL